MADSPEANKDTAQSQGAPQANTPPSSPDAAKQPESATNPTTANPDAVDGGELESTSADEKSTDNKNFINATTSSAGPPDPEKPDVPIKGKVVERFIHVIRQFDVYLLLFLLVLLVAAVAVFVGVKDNKPPAPKNTTTTQTLSESALSQVNNNDTQVGGNGQILTIQSNTVFGGSTLVKGNLQVAGAIQVGGSLSLPGITVSGATKLGDVSANNLSISGSETISDQLTVQQGLTVNGPTTFSAPISAPQLTVSNLQINGDIIISHHLVTIGSIPKDETLSAIGSGGSSSVNGTDTAGVITVNTGSNASNGCLATITFTKAYNSIPNVILTQVQTSSNVPDLTNYYVNRTTTGFSVCSQATPQAVSFGFDYIVID